MATTRQESIGGKVLLQQSNDTTSTKNSYLVTDGVSTTPPNTDTLLEIRSTTQGVVLPSVTSATTTTAMISYNPTSDNLVFNSQNKGKGRPLVSAPAGSTPVSLPAGNGTNGQVLTSDGAGGTSWVTGAAGSGTVTNVTSTAGTLTITNPTTTPNIDLPTTGVTLGTYTNTSMTVDKYGRVASAASGTAPVTNVTSNNTANIVVAGTTTSPTIDLKTTGTAGTYTFPSQIVTDAYGRSTSITSGTAPVTSLTGTTDITITGTTTPTVSLATTGVTAGTYTNANITVDTKGRLASASNGTASGGTVTSISSPNSTLTIASPTTTPTIDLPATGVTSGTYTNASVTVDKYGRIASAASGTAGGVTSVTAGTGTTGSITGQALSIGVTPELQGLSALSTTGIVQRTGTGTYTAGSITTSTGSVLHGYVTTTYTTNVGASDHIIFNGTLYNRGTDITLDTSSTYTQISGQPSMGRITLQPGKLYKLTGSINNTSANTDINIVTQWFNVTTSTAVALSIPGINPPPAKSSPVVPSGVMIVYIDLTSASTPSIVELRINSNAGTIFNNTGGSPWFTAESIAPMVLTTANSPTISHGYITTGYSSNIGVGDHLQFNSTLYSRGTDITLNTTSTYTSTSGVASIGRITLAAGKLYKLMGSVNNTNNSASGTAQWYNVTGSTAVALSIASVAGAPSSTSTLTNGAGVAAYVDLTAAISPMVVELRLLEAASQIAQDTTHGSPYYTIEVVGAPPSTGVTSVTGTANQITVTGTTAPTIAIATNPTIPGNTTITGNATIGPSDGSGTSTIYGTTDLGTVNTGLLNCNSMSVNTNVLISGGLTVLGGTNNSHNPVGEYTKTGYTGNVTTADGCSIVAGNAIAAVEFLAYSSQKKKNILAGKYEAQEEALELFKKIPLFKYNHKDHVNQGILPYYGTVAEPLAEITPQYVKLNHEAFIPNIYQEANEIIKQDNGYIIEFKNPVIIASEANKVRLIGREDIGVDLISFTDTSVVIEYDGELSGKLFIFGTYEKCPTVDKTGVLELAMVAFQGQIAKVEELTTLVQRQDLAIKSLTEIVMKLQKR